MSILSLERSISRDEVYRVVRDFSTTPEVPPGVSVNLRLDFHGRNFEVETVGPGGLHGQIMTIGIVTTSSLRNTLSRLANDARGEIPAGRLVIHSFAAASVN